MSRLHGGLLLVLALLLAVAPATAPTQFAVNITDVAVEQLTNGLRITVKADGLLEAETTGSWYQTNEDHEFPVWLSNAHSSVGTFVDISRYPVNYLKLETPSDSREGVGVMLPVRLYRSAHVRSVDLDNQRTDWTWDWDPATPPTSCARGGPAESLASRSGVTARSCCRASRSRAMSRASKRASRSISPMGCSMSPP